MSGHSFAAQALITLRSAALPHPIVNGARHHLSAASTHGCTRCPNFAACTASYVALLNHALGSPCLIILAGPPCNCFA